MGVSLRFAGWAGERERQRGAQPRVSIPRVAWRARKRDGVAHVGKTGDIGQRALEAEAETRVRHRAVATQIAVPGVMLLIDAAFRHARVQHLEPLLALAAADDLANPGC